MQIRLLHLLAGGAAAVTMLAADAAAQARVFVIDPQPDGGFVTRYKPVVLHLAGAAARNPDEVYIPKITRLRWVRWGGSSARGTGSAQLRSDYGNSTQRVSVKLSGEQDVACGDESPTIAYTHVSFHIKGFPHDLRYDLTQAGC